jgi:hypothetical protein
MMQAEAVLVLQFSSLAALSSTVVKCCVRLAPAHTYEHVAFAEHDLLMWWLVNEGMWGAQECRRL